MTEHAAAALDLSSFDDFAKRQEEGVAVDIKSPDGRYRIGLQIFVCGPDSERQRKALQKLQDQRLADEDPGPVSAAEIDRRMLENLASAVVKWEPAEVKFGGKLHSFSEASVRDLFRAHPFIREQVQARANSRAGFLTESPKTSAEPSKEPATAETSGDPT